MLIIQTRKKIEVNTDPQRRCYNGCHFSSEFVWQPWENLVHCTQEKVEGSLKFWTELNDYAVSQRGESARSEFRVIEETAEETHEHTYN